MAVLDGRFSFKRNIFLCLWKSHLSFCWNLLSIGSSLEKLIRCRFHLFRLIRQFTVVWCTPDKPQTQIVLSHIWYRKLQMQHISARDLHIAPNIECMSHSNTKIPTKRNFRPSKCWVVNNLRRGFACKVKCKLKPAQSLQLSGQKTLLIR